MTHKRILFFFILAGLILAAVLGSYFYRSNLGPTHEAMEDLLREFTEAIADGDLQKARSLMTPETAVFLRDPGTVLGEKVYRSLKLKTVDNIYTQDKNVYTADVTLTAVDTLKVIAKAGQLFGEQIAENGPTDDPDQAMADIYSQILSREDLPVINTFCVVRLEMRNGNLYIIGDASLQRVLEGDPETYSEMLERIREKK